MWSRPTRLAWAGERHGRRDRKHHSGTEHAIPAFARTGRPGPWALPASGAPRRTVAAGDRDHGAFDRPRAGRDRPLARPRRRLDPARAGAAAQRTAPSPPRLAV